MPNKLINFLFVVVIAFVSIGCQAEKVGSSNQNFVEVDGKLYAPACIKNSSVCVTKKFARNVKLAVLIGARNANQQGELFNYWEKKNGFSSSSIDPNFEFQSGTIYIVAS